MMAELLPLSAARASKERSQQQSAAPWRHCEASAPWWHSQADGDATSVSGRPATVAHGTVSVPTAEVVAASSCGSRSMREQWLPWRT